MRTSFTLRGSYGLYQKQPCAVAALCCRDLYVFKTDGPLLGPRPLYWHNETYDPKTLRLGKTAAELRINAARQLLGALSAQLTRQGETSRRDNGQTKTCNNSANVTLVLQALSFYHVFHWIDGNAVQTTYILLGTLHKLSSPLQGATSQSKRLNGRYCHKFQVSM